MSTGRPPRSQIDGEPRSRIEKTADINDRIKQPPGPAEGLNRCRLLPGHL